MEDNMFVPKSVIDRITRHSDNLKHHRETITNWNVCVKMPYKGYIISLGIDSSLGDNDLRRGDFLVDKDGVDVSKEFMIGDQHTLYGEMETLLTICKQIDARILGHVVSDENVPCHFCQSTVGYGEYEGMTDYPRCMNCGAC